MAPTKALAKMTEIAPGVHWLPTRAANVYFVQSGSAWVLIDTGLRSSAPAIREAAKVLFGPDSRPQAILLTHPHGDHVGAAAELARAWDVPVHAHDLPSGDTLVPGLADWECIPTPGHSRGHVVYFRGSDRVLIAGDAVMTAPLWGLLLKVQRISPPIRLASWDWQGVKDSVAKLAALEPAVLACGHGIPMTGTGVAEELRAFSDRFSRSSKPAGRG